MERQTVDELLQWLREAPRTLGWNAIVAYDKTHANIALAQDYIARFNSDSYLRPISDKVDTAEGETEYLYGLSLDSPRLSFENAKVQWSLAKLAVKVVGGTQVTLRTQSGGQPQVVQVSSYDALNGPVITMGLSLGVSLGDVDVKGRIVLDLSKGTDISVNFADTPEKRRIGGDFFRTCFENLPDEQKVFVLGQVVSTEGQFLKPHNVQIRTHAAPGAGEPGSPVTGKGAVLMFITMEGEAFGTFPSEDIDLHYLIPGDMDFCTSTLLLDNAFFIRRFIEEGCRRMSQSTHPFTCEIEHSTAGFVTHITALSGQYTGQPFSRQLPGVRVVLPGLKTPLTAQGDAQVSFELSFEGDAVVMQWKGQIQQDCQLVASSTVSYPLPSSWLWRKRYKMKVDPQNRTLTWGAEGDELSYCKVAPGAYAELPEFAQHFASISACVEAQLGLQLELCVEQFMSPLEHLDVFRLNSILFQVDQVIQPTRSELAGDLVIFGEVAAGSTAFTISPLEPLIGPGEALQFSVSTNAAVRQVGELVWTVENIPGTSGNTGRVDGNGLYTAPAVTEISGRFKRVRVKVSRGAQSSSALVSIALRDVTFNPLIVVVGTGQKREMSAVARDASQLEWTIADPSSGSQVIASLEPGGDHTYIAPPVQDKPAYTFSLDEVWVRHAGSETHYTSYVLVVNRPVNAQVFIKADATLPPGSIALYADLGLGEVTSGCSWSLLAGSGEVDPQTGVYTSDPDGVHAFALITVLIAPPSPIYPAFEGYIIVPLPLSLAIGATTGVST